CLQRPASTRGQLFDYIIFTFNNLSKQLVFVFQFIQSVLSIFNSIIIPFGIAIHPTKSIRLVQKISLLILQIFILIIVRAHVFSSFVGASEFSNQEEFHF
ncbi:TPA: hypothetical protein L6B16_33075, partial [Pseudomonas aeruginosa]|nr:hypothetical protein [Pseudomonas aeruginosa]